MIIQFQIQAVQQQMLAKKVDAGRVQNTFSSGR